VEVEVDTGVGGEARFGCKHGHVTESPRNDREYLDYPTRDWTGRGIMVAESTQDAAS
jgi:hypothetical protein